MVNIPVNVMNLKNETDFDDEGVDNEIVHGVVDDIQIKEFGFGLDAEDDQEENGTPRKRGKIWRVPDKKNGRPEFKMSCPECGKVCGDMVSHIKVNHKGMDWRGIKTPCPFEECGKVLVDIQNHIRLVHLKIKNFECEHCDAKFSNRYQVRMHTNGVHSNVRVKCPQCDTMLKVTTLKMHIRNVHEGGGTKVACKEQDCTKLFGSNADLERHVVSVHMKIKAPCPDCGKRFRMETLANHIKTQHKGIYPYMCKQCDKGFQNLKHLHIHVRTKHYGVFVFCKALNSKGEVCGKKFYSEEGLQKHVEKLHLKTEDAKEEICPECGIAVLPTSLQRHMDEVHSKISNKCCPVENCGERFTDKFSLQRHVDKVHNKLASREWCDLCEEFKQDLKAHFKLVHMDHEKLPCTWPQCTYQAKTPQDLEKHIKYRHERKTRVPCDECGKSVRDLYIHKRSIHRKIASHFCKECGKGFPTKSTLKNHVNKIHLQLRSTCGDCGAQVANLQQHQRFVHEKRMAAVCDVPGCDTTFANQLSKRKHMKSVHEGIRDTCPECGKQVSSLKSHIRIVHKKERPHECPECGKTFQTRTHLRNHLQRVHLGLRIKCEECGKMVQDIRNHRAFVHMGVKNFPCDQCETRCTTSTALKLHILSVHLGVKEHCDICNKDVAPNVMKKHVRDHIKTEEDKKPHICLQCEKTFKDPGSLKKHVLRIHLGVTEECPRCGIQTKDLYRHMKYIKCQRDGYTPRRQKRRSTGSFPEGDESMMFSARRRKSKGVKEEDDPEYTPDKKLDCNSEDILPRRLRDLDYTPGMLQEPDFNRNIDMDFKEETEEGDFSNWGLVEELEQEPADSVDAEVDKYMGKLTGSSSSRLESDEVDKYMGNLTGSSSSRLESDEVDKYMGKLSGSSSSRLESDEVDKYMGKLTGSSSSRLESDEVDKYMGNLTGRSSSRLESDLQMKRKRDPLSDQESPNTRRKHESGSSVENEQSYIEIAPEDLEGLERSQSGSSGSFYGFPSDNEDSLDRAPSRSSDVFHGFPSDHEDDLELLDRPQSRSSEAFHGFPSDLEDFERAASRSSQPLHGFGSDQEGSERPTSRSENAFHGFGSDTEGLERAMSRSEDAFHGFGNDTEGLERAFSRSSGDFQGYPSDLEEDSERAQSRSSGAFHGFPRGRESGLEGDLDVRRESVVTGSDVIELEEDDAFFNEEEESDVLMDLVEPVDVGSVDNSENNDPLDIRGTQEGDAEADGDKTKKGGKRRSTGIKKSKKK